MDMTVEQKPSPTDVPTLVLVCKRPALHQGKQRIAATLGSENALKLAYALLDCALEDANAWPGPVVIAPAHEQDHHWAGSLLSRPCQVLSQGSGNLGERLNTLDHHLRKQGVNRTVYIGSDAPILNEAYFTETINALMQQDVVLSPASDGGVTIMANARPWPTLEALPWSTSQLGQSLAALCREQELGVTSISPSYDIDNEKDLLILQQDIVDDLRPARQRLARLLPLTLKKNLSNA